MATDAENIAAIQEAKTKQQTAKAIQDTAAKANETLNNTISATLAPIYDSIRSLKTIPPKIKKPFDITSAQQGLYAQVEQLTGMMSYSKLSTIMTSAEVPINVDDFYADIYKYPNLLPIEYSYNEVTQDDCDNSGYKKVEWTLSETETQKIIELLNSLEDSDYASEQAEKQIQIIIGILTNSLLTPIQSVIGTANSIATLPPPLDAVTDFITAISDAFSKIAEIAGTPLTEKDLNEMIAKKQAVADKAAQQAQLASINQINVGKSTSDLAKEAISKAEGAIEGFSSGTIEGVEGAFKNFQAPEIPDDVQQTMQEFYEALIYAKDNFNNIYVVAMLNALAQIADKLGSVLSPVPCVSELIELATKISSTYQYINGLPGTLMTSLKAVMKRKMKAIQIAMTPIPPLPVQQKIPLPPVPTDVVYPEDESSYFEKLETA